MKKFYIFIIALMMILMSIPVSAHDECVDGDHDELNFDFIYNEEIAMASDTCNHDYEYYSTKASYHTYKCTKCNDLKYEDHIRINCNTAICVVCSYEIGSLSHVANYYRNVSSTYGSEKHEPYCNRYYDSYGYCGSLGATEQCIYHVKSTNIRYTLPKLGYHKKYQICGKCSTEVYTGEVRCQLDIGYMDCSYCG